MTLGALSTNTMTSGLGNIQAAIGTPNASGQPPAPAQPPPRPNIASMVAQLHPATQQALKSIPPAALQQLHNAGLIHPGLMQHLSTGLQR
jgi:hypothetical protein